MAGHCMVIREGQGDFLGQIGAMKARLQAWLPWFPWFLVHRFHGWLPESRIPVPSKWKRKEERARCHNSAYLSMTIPWYHSARLSTTVDCYWMLLIWCWYVQGKFATYSVDQIWQRVQTDRYEVTRKWHWSLEVAMKWSEELRRLPLSGVTCHKLDLRARVWLISPIFSLACLTATGKFRRSSRRKCTRNKTGGVSGHLIISIRIRAENTQDSNDAKSCKTRRRSDSCDRHQERSEKLRIRHRCPILVPDSFVLVPDSWFPIRVPGKLLISVESTWGLFESFGMSKCLTYFPMDPDGSWWIEGPGWDTRSGNHPTSCEGAAQGRREETELDNIR